MFVSNFLQAQLNFPEDVQEVYDEEKDPVYKLEATDQKVKSESAGSEIDGSRLLCMKCGKVRKSRQSSMIKLKRTKFAVVYDQG